MGPPGSERLPRAYRTDLMTVPAQAPAVFEERIGPTRRSWLWLLAIVVITFFAIGPVFVPVAMAAWLVNVVRYRRARVRVEDDYLFVGKRWVRLAALDLGTLGRAGNTWPWRAFNRRYLGANPLWTHDSVALRGIDGGQVYWVVVGTDRRDELVATLEQAIPAAQSRVGPAPWASPTSAFPPPGWHPDPWAPDASLRWWDGGQWTGFTAPRPGAPSNAPSGAPWPPPAAQP
jgi:hypothetical protein